MIIEKIEFRASSWGNLLSESRTKGEVIGKTCAENKFGNGYKIVVYSHSTVIN